MRELVLMNSNLPAEESTKPEGTAEEQLETVSGLDADAGADTQLGADDAAASTPVDGEDAADDDDRDEGDIAADFLEELLDIADIDGDLEIEIRKDRTYVSVESDDADSNLKVLSERKVVDALQQLTRLAVQAETAEPARLILDIAGSREARKVELKELVDRAIARIEEGAASAALPPMTSYERKLVHDIAGELGYSSESEGEGAGRHTVLRKEADSQ